MNRDREPIPAQPVASPRPPETLDYPSPPLSAYDRPVEPVVKFARRFRLVIRICYLIFALLVVGFAVWGALRMAEVFDGYSQ
jgi:hypothetical protein